MERRAVLALCLFAVLIAAVVVGLHGRLADDWRARCAPPVDQRPILITGRAYEAWTCTPSSVKVVRNGTP